MARRIGLVAASRWQRGTICRAAEQYDPSPVFRRARDYCARHYGEWYVVSVRHHLLLPQQVIGPGEPALAGMCAEQRNRWAERVAEDLRSRRARTAEPVTFVLYASQRYADALQRAAPELTFELPLAGLSLRDRIRWYDERLQTRSRVLAYQVPGA